MRKMRYILLGMAIAAMLFTSIRPIYSAGISENVKQAVKILKGLDNSHDKIWAVQVLCETVEQDSSAYAMNVLGIAYMKGIGVSQNDSLAAHWLECAGRYGYKDAFHNLGMFYKNKPHQDFIRSADSFRKGAEAGSLMCFYDYGFMLYKGLGCNQNYAQAIDFFRRGADYDHAPCLYMLGLCYRNGYGVEKDTDKAMFYLHRSATLSYRFAMEELNREEAENSWEQLYADELPMEIPATMPDIQPLITDISSLKGDFQGVLVTYDWSGQDIIEEHPLKFIINTEGKELSGYWHEGSDTVCVKAEISDDGHLLFNESSIKRNERYVEEGPVRYKFESADICANGNLITGRMRLYSMKEREPERPMYISLQKVSSEGKTDANDGHNNEAHIYAYPNPFSDHVTIHFELTNDVQHAKAHIYSQSGVNIQSFNLGSLEAGKHSFTLSPSVYKGTYVLCVAAGNQLFRTIIVRK